MARTDTHAEHLATDSVLTPAETRARRGGSRRGRRDDEYHLEGLEM